MVLMRFRLNDIMLATENFAETYRIGLSTNGYVYNAELDYFGNNGENVKKPIPVSIKRTTSKGRHGRQEFFEEIEMHACKHPNIVQLLGFSDEGDEMILVYEHVSGTSLDNYLKRVDNKNNFTWTHRLHICLEIARGLNHLHTRMADSEKIMLNDLRSANILLDKNAEPKIASFVISMSHPPNQEIGKKVYEDLEYRIARARERESTIYSFGVVLYEIFCGKVAYDPVFIEENEDGLAPFARKCFNDGTIERIIDPSLKEETGENFNDSLYIFVRIAHECLGAAVKRPSMETVIVELELALKYHESQFDDSFPVSPQGRRKRVPRM